MPSVKPRKRPIHPTPGQLALPGIEPRPVIIRQFALSKAELRTCWVISGTRWLLSPWMAPRSAVFKDVVRERMAERLRAANDEICTNT